jgi:hypothetical protein
MEFLAVIEDDPDVQHREHPFPWTPASGPRTRWRPTTDRPGRAAHLTSFRGRPRRKTNSVEPGPVPDHVPFPVADPPTQIVTGLEQLVMLTRGSVYGALEGHSRHISRCARVHRHSHGPNSEQGQRHSVAWPTSAGLRDFAQCGPALDRAKARKSHRTVSITDPLLEEPQSSGGVARHRRIGRRARHSPRRSLRRPAPPGGAPRASQPTAPTVATSTPSLAKSTAVAAAVSATVMRISSITSRPWPGGISVTYGPRTSAMCNPKVMTRLIHIPSWWGYVRQHDKGFRRSRRPFAPHVR